MSIAENLEMAGYIVRDREVKAELRSNAPCSVNDPHAAFHLRFGRETFATFAGDFKV